MILYTLKQRVWETSPHIIPSCCLCFRSSRWSDLVYCQKKSSECFIYNQIWCIYPLLASYCWTKSIYFHLISISNQIDIPLSDIWIIQPFLRNSTFSKKFIHVISVSSSIFIFFWFLVHLLDTSITAIQCV